jgi:hypothetical protein
MPGDSLAPPPEFRYVGLSPYRPRSEWFARALAVGAGGFVCSAPIIGISHALVPALCLATGVLAAQRVRRRVHLLSRNAAPAAMAIVPWGVQLAEDEVAPRALFWSATERLEVDTVHDKEDGVSRALYSVVRLQTAFGQFCGMTEGGAPLDHLEQHVPAYAQEQLQAIALDLDGREAMDPLEPDVGSLLSAAKSMLAGASPALGLSGGSYRLPHARAGGEQTHEVLGGIVRDRTPRAHDPRALALVLAAELRMDALLPDILPLTRSPHPFLAACARRAAAILGASGLRTGSLAELGTFLSPEHVADLEAWSAA